MQQVPLKDDTFRSAAVRAWMRSAPRNAASAGRFGIVGSPLTRKIVAFNLVALNILIVGILFLNAPRDSLVLQRAESLVGEAELVANVLEAQPSDLNQAGTYNADRIQAVLGALRLRNGIEVFVFDPADRLIGRMTGTDQSAALTALAESQQVKTPISSFIAGLNRLLGVPWVAPDAPPVSPLRDQLRAMLDPARSSGTQIETGYGTEGGTVISAVTPVLRDDWPGMVVAVSSPAGQIDALVLAERERVLRMFVVATLVSVGLSLLLASAIATPIADLARAAEFGRNGDPSGMAKGRIRIPDLTSRPDEIGRLSGAMRGMVSALYSRIDGNEQFAADVAHEIKNPLASLRSAVGTLRMVGRDDQKARLYDVIEHDVRRLDRLVSDISNASRLDSELVKEDEEPFDLIAMLNNINQHLGADARSAGIDFVTDLPQGPVMIRGLEARLAQVFVNLVSNATSFCEAGDAVRVWVRKRSGRILIAVEDTGPGIPNEALTKIFKRFYSERPKEHFGNNSGLGLAISKQIVEAHGGVIWAENIEPTKADCLSDPLGARFVVGLPI